MLNRHQHRPDDDLPRDSGVYRRRHDPFGLCGGFHDLSARGIADAQAGAIQQMSGIVHKQAMVLSFIDVFQLLTVLFVTLSLLAMAMRKPAARGAGGGH